MHNFLEKIIKKSQSLRPEHPLFLLALIAAGYLGNYFKLSLFFGIDFLFGTIAVWIILSFYGTFWAIIAGAIASIHTYVLWHHPYAIIIFAAEVLFVSYFWQKKPNSIAFYNAIYWFIIGIPLVCIFYGFSLSMNLQGVAVVALKQSVNGIFNAEIASLFVTYFPIEKNFIKLKRRSNKYSLQQVVFNILLAFIIFPILALVIITSKERFFEIEQEINQTLVVSSESLIEELQLWEKKYLNVSHYLVDLIAQEGMNSQQSKDAIREVENLYPELTRIDLFDPDGNFILHFYDGEISSITDIAEDTKTTKMMHHFQDYLQNKAALKQGKTAIIDHQDNEIHLDYFLTIQGNNGYFHTELNADLLNAFLQRELQGVKQYRLRAVVTDSSTGIVVADSNTEKITRGQKWDWYDLRDNQALSKQTFLSMPAQSKGKSPMTRWRNAFGVILVPGKDTLLPIDLWLMLEVKPYIDGLEVYYIRSLSIVLCLLVIAVATATKISHWLAKPINQLSLITTNIHQQFQDDQDIKAPDSLILEFDRLSHNFQIMIQTLRQQFQEIQSAKETLEDQVQARTIDLSQEILQRQSAEMKLRKSEERYELAIAATNDGIWDWDVLSGEIYYSPSWMKIVGYEDQPQPNTFVGWSELVHPDDLEEAIKNMQQHLDGETPIYQNINRVLHRDGNYRWILGKAKCLRDETGKPYRVVGTMTDITANVEAEEQIKLAKEEAEQASRAKSEFLATMSHEIRTPMNAVMGMTSLLMDTPLNQQQKEFVEIMSNSGSNLLAIINDILDFSKIESGKFELEIQSFNLRSCIETCLDLVSARARGKSIDLTYLMDASIPSLIKGDATRLRQVIMNLLDNAVKFTEHGEIVLNVQAVSQETSDPNSLVLTFAVMDTGIGILPEHLERLFQPFSQGDASTSRQYGGTGLGLVISKRLVEMMGGEIWVVSGEAIARDQSAREAVPNLNDSHLRCINTIFYFRLPMAIASDESIKPVQTSEPIDLAHKNLLILHPSAIITQSLNDLAICFAIQVRYTTSISEALFWITEDSIDVMLWGLDSPDNGEITLQRIREQSKNPNLAVILIGEIAETTHLNSAWYKSLNGRLTKPVKQSQLYDCLVSVLETQPQSKSAKHPVKKSQFDENFGSVHPLKILLAEDNVVNQKVALNILRRLGYRADVAANGLEVLDALNRQHYDVILMDVQMPKMDGLEATQYIKNNGSSIGQGFVRPRIIAMTANAMQGDRQICLDAGMDDYLSKPIHVPSLTQALRQAYQAHQPSSTLDSEINP